MFAYEKEKKKKNLKIRKMGVIERRGYTSNREHCSSAAAPPSGTSQGQIGQLRKRFTRVVHRRFFFSKPRGGKRR